MKKAKVALWQQPRGYATVEDGATKGATFGQNVWWPDGTLVKQSDFTNAGATVQQGAPSQTLWSLVLQIPTTVKVLAGATGSGYYNSAGVFRGVAADEVTYDPTTTGLAATDVQAAVDELAAAIGDGAIGCTFDGGGAALTVGAFVDVQAPFDATINAATLVGDPSGSLVISVWKDVLANYPPTSGDNIAASAPPTLSSAAHSRDTSLTGWTKTITKGDVLRFTVQSCSSITRASLVLEVTKA